MDLTQNNYLAIQLYVQKIQMYILKDLFQIFKKLRFYTRLKKNINSRVWKGSIF